MSDFLSRLVARSAPLPHAVQPRPRSVFEPADTTLAADANDESGDDHTVDTPVSRTRVAAHEQAPSAQFRGLLDQIEELRARTDAVADARATDAPAAHDSATTEPTRALEPTHRRIECDGAPAQSPAVRPANRREPVHSNVPVHRAIEPARTTNTPLPIEHVPAQVEKTPAQIERERGFDIVARAILGERPVPDVREKQTIQPRSIVVQQSPAHGRVTPAHEARSTGEHSDTAPVIHINIGRIEVRAVRDAERAPARPTAPQPKLTIEEYVRDRRKGAR